jgi:hypothetical protein
MQMCAIMWYLEDFDAESQGRLSIMNDFDETIILSKFESLVVLVHFLLLCMNTTY